MAPSGAAMNLIKTFTIASALGGALALALPARAETPAELLARYSAAAAVPADAGRGQQFFTTTHGREWSCSSCHGAVPVQTGKHAATGKPIQPMAPAFNAERFTDSAKSEKWFRRNCNDVVGRECTAGEKADLIAWLLTLKA
jgi:mono/diheme cytochrome c family protein